MTVSVPGPQRPLILLTGATAEVVHGDVLGPRPCAALKDVETAYYLVHSMGSGGSFAKADREAASAFASAARATSVRRIIYLGGLGKGDLSEHLASRQEVGGILRGSSVPTIEVQLIDRDRRGVRRSSCCAHSFSGCP